MSSPRSNLDAVRRHRQRRVDELREEYASALRHLHDAEARAEDLERILARTLQELARRMDEGMAPDDLDAYYRFIAHQSTEIAAEQDALDRIRADCEIRRNILVQAKQNERLIASIERARAEAARRGRATQEQHALDDLVASRAVMKGDRRG